MKHKRERDRARGTRQQRGYDATYDRERARIVKAMRAGQVFRCWRCLRVVGLDFHLGHDDHDRSIIRGPEHPACNLGAAGRASHERHP